MQLPAELACGPYGDKEETVSVLIEREHGPLTSPRTSNSPNKFNSNNLFSL